MQANSPFQVNSTLQAPSLLQLSPKIQDTISARADVLYTEARQEIFRSTDRLLARLMLLQWIAGIVAALWISPFTWIGEGNRVYLHGMHLHGVHLHVWAAIFLGGAISIFPIWLALVYPGRNFTRYTIAGAQMLMSALLIHLSGGRIETHFHVFGSLVMLSFYRDWRVLIPATIVVALDHFVRGMYVPQSVYGVLTATPWRTLEHAAWVAFADIFLIGACLRSVREMRAIAENRAQLETTNQIIEEKVIEQTARVHATLDATADGILVCGAGGKIENFNRKFLQMWRIPAPIAETAIGWKHDSLLAFIQEQLSDPAAFRRSVQEIYAQPDAESFDTIEFKDGRTFERYSQPHKLGGKSIGRVWSFHDITQRRVAEEQLVHDAFHDKLTGLPNRALFMDRLEQSILRAERHDASLYAVLFLDLDRFKVINDSLGHLAGDEFLVAAARRLQKLLRPSDTVARLGGDEFTILLEDIEDVNAAIQVAERIQQEIRLPFKLGGQEVISTVSIGIALGGQHYDKPDDLLRDADMAMYRAKTQGKARHEVFDMTMHAHAVQRLQLETALWRALDRQEFRVHYQPIISLQDDHVTGFEALVRWQHPERGLVAPADFIPIAEETGLIVPIGSWVLREACRQLRSWQQTSLVLAGRPSRPLTMNVNLSAKQLAQPDLIEQIDRILHETGLDPQFLKLEITESTIMDNVDEVTSVLLQLRERGIQLGIDDFGTGYSSLSYLHRFPIMALKVDRSFISRMGDDQENLEIVRTIVTLAHNLKMDVVAEGVETAEQLAQLRALGCELGQGYLFSKPVNCEVAESLLERADGWWSNAATPRARAHRSTPVPNTSQNGKAGPDETTPHETTPLVSDAATPQKQRGRRE